jgi:hypothetical protein
LRISNLAPFYIFGIIYLETVQKLRKRIWEITQSKNNDQPPIISRNQFEYFWTWKLDLSIQRDQKQCVSVSRIWQSEINWDIVPSTSTQRITTINKMQNSHVETIREHLWNYFKYIWGENWKNQVNNEMLLLALWRVFDINIGAVLPWIQVLWSFWWSKTNQVYFKIFGGKTRSK